jgi:hypothetical protein
VLSRAPAQHVELRRHDAEQQQVDHQAGDRAPLVDPEQEDLAQQQVDQHRAPEPLVAPRAVRPDQPQPDRRARQGRRAARQQADHRPPRQVGPGRHQHDAAHHRVHRDERQHADGHPRQPPHAHHAPGRRDDRAGHRADRVGQLPRVVLDHVEQRPDLGRAPDVAGAGHELARLPPGARGEPAREAGDGQVGRGGQRLVRIAAPAVDDLPDQDQHDHDDVDQRRRRLVEVVVVRRDELADLVDEQPEPDPADQRGERPDHRAGPGQHRDDGDRHEQPAPEHVRDVQAVAAELREPGQREQPARHQDGQHRDGEEPRDVPRPGRVARQPQHQHRRPPPHVVPVGLGRGVARPPGLRAAAHRLRFSRTRTEIEMGEPSKPNVSRSRRSMNRR